MHRAPGLVLLQPDPSSGVLDVMYAFPGAAVTNYQKLMAENNTLWSLYSSGTQKLSMVSLG